ncbi:hypothetical protein BJ508DRAFT_326967 [Ascobolus immersus RN42]|uniref:Extracellular membrane protein CFEM domain-containing protein n=1 Tax=Ascobolus immersus RN42 TaxID=1160509 RepID=A0A3N4I625_ASCIM|nr:hypothetical protein BJ508DRAFT_326967 [Ascobolus immersus RN42]
MQFSRNTILALSTFFLTASAQILQDITLANPDFQTAINDLFEALPECSYACLALESGIAPVVLEECFGDEKTMYGNDSLACACSKVKDFDGILKKTQTCLTKEEFTDEKGCKLDDKALKAYDLASKRLGTACAKQIELYPNGLKMNTTIERNGTVLNGPTELERLDNGTVVVVDQDKKNEEKKDDKDEKDENKEDKDDGKDSGSAVFTVSSVLLGLGFFAATTLGL